MAEKKKEVEVTLVSQLESKKPIYQIKGKTPKIETGVDRLYNLVKQKERVRLSEAAKNLGVSEDTVVRWGEILEEHKMIELHYPMAGKPSLGVIRPKPRRGEKKKEKKEKPKIPGKKRFTVKSMFINIELVVLGLLLVYIFLINRYLSMNFLPTVSFHFNGFITYIQNLSYIITTGNFSALVTAMLLQPMYLGFLIIIIVIIILIIILIFKTRRPKLYLPEKKKEEKREKKEEPKKEEPKKKKPEKKEKKEVVFADIVKRYREKLKEMEK